MMKFSTVKTIAKDEWLFMWRNKVALVSILMLIALLFISVLSANEYRKTVNDERFYYQNEANHEFESQPDRHPHRVAHFGHFLFRPVEPLSTFDTGIDSYTGHTLFLEAHRQNTANFSDVRQSSLLIRFGQLSPAFVLQILAPLLLIFIGYATISRERQSGTLRLMLSQGVSGSSIFLGKFIALAGISILIISPAVIALLWISLTQSVSFPLTWLLITAYFIWLLIWALGITLVSSFLSNNRDALLGLLAIWTLQVILLPRFIPDVVNSQIPLRSNLETQIAVEKDLAELGDSHDENDPYFTDFKNKVLKKYGVSRVEDLPVNYKGLLMEEGERMTTELFNKYRDELVQQQNKQNHRIDLWSITTPVLALRRLSMAASASDLNNFNNFLAEGESYRYRLVQGLNCFETELITYADDSDESKENRIDKSHWQQFPEFNYLPSTASERIHHMGMPFLMLFLWFILLLLLIKPASNIIERKIK
ncbi:ABC transporter permease [Acinetobacter stercoris]|uniref:ABC-2 family transporter protein n=1 Tax=Acinetobacter stercoris TaxID=2126983 RepID=A0A2U3MX72_9GAMM|nr:DUF3526 domain-containing protein [Acinetobacter stercoris]SPL70026.1 ABC-2 family transporter protein [Acinetobacter stercoris]